MTVWTIKERNSLVRSNQAFGRDGDRLCFLGGQTPSNSNVIDFVEIKTTGNASDYGDLVTSFVHSGGSGGITLIAHGNQAAECSQKNFLTTGDTSTFGDLTADRYGTGNASNRIRTLAGGGFALASETRYDVIDYVNNASLGNFADFGNLSVVNFSAAGLADPTRAVFNGGETSSARVNTQEFVTIASTGNVTDFGNLQGITEFAGAMASKTKGIIGGGQGSPAFTNVINQVTIQTTGNSTDFGDLSAAKSGLECDGNATRGVFGGGQTPGTLNVIEYITFESAGNTSDFGDLSVGRERLGGVSNGHGGVRGDEQRPELFALNRPGQTIGMFGGGNFGSSPGTYEKTTEVVQVETLGRSSSFGDLTVAVSNAFSMSGNRTRGVRHSGYIGGSSPYTTNSMDYCEFSSRGNFADFGDATAAGYGASRGPSTNNTRSFSMGFYNAGGNLTTVDYWAPSTLGNAADFGDLSVGATKAAGMANTTRVIRYGSYDVNTIDYHAIASLGDFSDFGDAVAALGAGEAVSSPVRGVRCGAQSASNTMEYITMATTGNGTDFGDLTVGRSDPGAASSHTRGVIFGGSGSPAYVDTMDYITIASAGNATDFGNTSASRSEMAGMGNGHGGLV